MKFESFPFLIGWELTKNCNLRCNHCATSAGQKRTDELTLEESLRICDQFPDLLVQEVDFTGGEPLLNKNWPIIASYVNELDIATRMVTNGLTINQNMVIEIKESGISEIGVSLDGIEPIHDYIRGYKGLFKKVLKGIENLKKLGIPVTIITAVNMLNVEELDTIYELIQSIRVNNWQIQPTMPLGRINESPELKLSCDGYGKMGEFVIKHNSNDKNNLKISLADGYGYFTNYTKAEPSWQGCNAGIVTCGITSDGKIKGCLSLPDEFIEGDLRKQDLWDIWFHPDSFSYTRQFSKERLGDYCLNCDKGEQCQGGCSAMSYGSTESFHNDPYCFYRLENSLNK